MGGRQNDMRRHLYSASDTTALATSPLNASSLTEISSHMLTLTARPNATRILVAPLRGWLCIVACIASVAQAAEPSSAYSIMVTATDDSDGLRVLSDVS